MEIVEMLDDNGRVGHSDDEKDGLVFAKKKKNTHRERLAATMSTAFDTTNLYDYNCNLRWQQLHCYLP
jgi:hypothetical protein